VSKRRRPSKRRRKTASRSLPRNKTASRSLPRNQAASRSLPRNRGVATSALVAALASVAIVALGLAWVEGRESSPPGRLSETLNTGDTHDGGADETLDECGPGIENPTARVEVSARSTRPLVARVVAKVTGQDGRPLDGAAPMVTADMVEMPCAHTTDPVPMEEIPGKRGTYLGLVSVPMVGNYRLLVRVSGNEKGEGAATVSLTTPTSRP
jgi:hypothetical protein